MLSTHEIEAYRKDGQLTPDWRLPEDLLASMRDALARQLALYGDAPTDFIPLPHVAGDKPPGEALETARAFFDFVCHPLLLDLIEPLIGSDIIVWASALFCKPAGTGLEVPWHQDGEYWPIRPQATITVWIALDDADITNGCMQMIPGSHKLGQLQHKFVDRTDLTLNTALDDPRLDLDNPRNIELKAGQVSLHDAGIVHRSQPNRSERRRAGYAIRYMPATSLYDRTIDPGPASATVALDFSARPIWLVRGRDKHGSNDFTIGHTSW